MVLVMSKRKGFTLIELLVVIAIIALLMAILIPSLEKAREQAREAVCKSNLKHWGIVWSMYTDTNDGFFGEGWYPTSDKEHQWMNTLKPYYSDVDLLLCPAATLPLWEITSSGDVSAGPGTTAIFRAAWGRFSDDTPWPGYENAVGSYAENAWIGNPPSAEYNEQNEDPDKPLDYYWRTPNVKNPDNNPLILDCWWMGGFPKHTDYPPAYATDWQWWPEMCRYVIARHGWAINACFFDYSVRKVGLKQLWSLKWHRNFRTDLGPDDDAPCGSSGGWPCWLNRAKDYE
jgi:prepilin-type N-terminal cleavage/methylation domain-containing protein